MTTTLTPRASSAFAKSLPSPSSRPSIFASLTSIATSLIRHRRDLVASNAPLLNSVLSLLLRCLRSPRPNLGGRQTRTIVDNTPLWLDVVNHPLGSVEARAMARLLTSLTVKTVPRRNTRADAEATQARPAKAASLAGPMARHVPYILLAYVRLLTDLDALISTTVRRDLEPGIGSLCEMIGEKDRDAIMIGGGLDGGGKGVLKMVWERWEESKYVGRG